MTIDRIVTLVYRNGEKVPEIIDELGPFKCCLCAQDKETITPSEYLRRICLECDKALLEDL